MAARVDNPQNTTVSPAITISTACSSADSMPQDFPSARHQSFACGFLVARH